MRAVRLFVGALLIAGAQPLMAFEDKALQLTLNQQGLDLLAEEVSLRGIADIEDMAIDNQEAEAYGIDVSVEGIRFSARLGGLKFRNADRILPASIVISDARLHVDRIKLKKKILRATLRSTCKDTTVKVGHNGGEAVGVDVALSVQKHQIAADVQSVDFNISSDNYEVHGPDECSGDLGTGTVIKGIIRIVLDRARDRIEEAVKKKIAEMDDVIAEKLTAATHRDLAFEIPDNALMRAKTMKFTSYPSDLKLTRNELTFTLGLDMTGNKTKSKAQNQNDVEGPSVGTLSLNTDVITEILTVALHEQRGLIWLDEDRAPGLKEVLKQTSAASMWPDLTTRQLDSERLKLGIKMTSAPRLIRYPERQTVGLLVEELELHFYVKQEGVEMLYAVLSVNLSGELKPSIQNNKFTLQVTTSPQLGVTSRWGDGIVADPDIFEDDVATVLLSGIFDYLYASSASFQYVLPELSLGARAVYPSAVKVGNEFIDFVLNVR